MASRSIVASAARVASGQSAAKQHAGTEITLALEVTEGVGADSILDVSIEWSDDGVDWHQAEPEDAFAQVTQPEAPHRLVETFEVKAANYRVVWAIAGAAPSITFNVDEWVD